MNLSEVLPQILAASILYDGFSTFVCNSMTNKFISINEWKKDDDQILSIKKVDNEDKDQTELEASYAEGTLKKE